MDLKANVRVTFVCGEEQVEEIAGADEELGDLGPIVNSNQGGWVGFAITHFQRVIIHLRFKPTEKKPSKKLVIN